MGQNGGFRPLSEKVFAQSNSNLVCTLIGWLFRISFLFGHVGQILGLWWPQNDWKWGFPTIIWKSIHTIQFKLSEYWVTVQNWFAFWPCWQNFGPLVATKWPKMVVSDHYLKKYSHNPIQTWCVHLLGDCSEQARPQLELFSGAQQQKMLIKACFLIQPLEQEGRCQKCCIYLCSKMFINHWQVPEMLYIFVQQNVYKSLLSNENKSRVLKYSNILK